MNEYLVMHDHPPAEGDPQRETFGTESRFYVYHHPSKTRARECESVEEARRLVDEANGEARRRGVRRS